MKRLRILSFLAAGILLLYTPVFLSGADETYRLNGVTEAKEVPAFTLSNVWDGSFQDGLDDYVQTKLPGRPLMVRLRNSLTFSALRTVPNNNYSMNGDKNLFTWGNVSSFMQYEEPVTEADMEILAGKLERLQALLSQSGRKLFVFMTPCKVRYTEAELPWIDRVMAPKERKLGNHDALKAALSESTVPYFDSISWIEENRGNFDPRVPLFPRTGVHWSVYVGNLAGAAFGEFLEQESGYDLPKLRITAEPSEDPVYPDADAFETFNLLGKPYDAYYAPVIEEVEPGRDKPGVLFRGGSFMGQSLSMLIRQGYFGKDVYMENDQFFTDAFQNKVIFHDYDAVDMQEAFRDIDLVVLEVNEPSVPSMSFGFIDYVLEHPEVLDAS